MSYRGKSRRKPYFNSNFMAKKKKGLCLQAGMKGFICTCNGNEKQCIRESYNILNEYGDRLYGEEKTSSAPKPECDTTAAAETDANDREEDDEMDEFKKEVDALKSQNNQSDRRFQAVDAGVANCVFIKTNLPDPVHLTDTIMRDLADTKQLKARFLLRMIPIEVTCGAHLDGILKTAAPLIDRYFKTDALTYAIVISKRCNSSVERDPLIEKLATMVQERNKDHKVDLSNPSITIIVEAMRGICGLAMIRDYFKLGKYNLRQLCGVPLDGAGDSSSVKDSSQADVDEEATPETAECASNCDEGSEKST